MPWKGQCEGNPKEPCGPSMGFLPFLILDVQMLAKSISKERLLSFHFLFFIFSVFFTDVTSFSFALLFGFRVASMQILYPFYLRALVRTCFLGRMTLIGLVSFSLCFLYLSKRTVLIFNPT